MTVSFTLTTLSDPFFTWRLIARQAPKTRRWKTKLWNPADELFRSDQLGVTSGPSYTTGEGTDIKRARYDLCQQNGDDLASFFTCNCGQAAVGIPYEASVVLNRVLVEKFTAKIPSRYGNSGTLVKRSCQTKRSYPKRWQTVCKSFFGWIQLTNTAAWRSCRIGFCD